MALAATTLAGAKALNDKVIRVTSGSAIQNKMLVLVDSEFMPKPGRLLELARMTPNRGAQAYGRALKAVTGGEPEQIRPEPTESERQAVLKMLGDFNAEIAKRTVANARPPLPSPS